MYVVIKVTQTGDSVERLTKHRDRLIAEGTRVPELFLVDATIQPSASKRK
jgi:hypothetical protein